MFAHDQGWLHRLREAVDDGPDRRGRRRARAVRHPRAHDARHRSLSARAPARPGRPRQPADAPAHGPGPRPAARAASRQCGSGGAQHGSGRAPRLRPPQAARADPRRGRADLACRHRRPRTRHSPPSARWPISRAWSNRATRSSSMASRARSMSGPPPTSKPPMPSACGCAPVGRRNIASCATSRASAATASRSRC